MRLAKQLRIRRKPESVNNENGDSDNGGGYNNSSNGASTSAGAEDGESASVGGEGNGGSSSGDGRVTDSVEHSSKDTGFPGSLIKSWWNSRLPYDGAAGFGLMREEMLIKSNARQV